MFVYNTDSEQWSSDLKNPSGERLRGAAAVDISDGKLYLAAGSSGGHGPSTTLRNYTDFFDTANPQEGWKPLPDFSGPRDHTGAIVGSLFALRVVASEAHQSSLRRTSRKYTVSI